jgi:hypothetical protein
MTLLASGLLAPRTTQASAGAEACVISTIAGARFDSTKAVRVVLMQYRRPA